MTASIVERLRAKSSLLVCEDAADVIERLKSELLTAYCQYEEWSEERVSLLALAKTMVDALEKTDALIAYQFSGSRGAMSALQDAAFSAETALAAYRELIKDEK